MRDGTHGGLFMSATRADGQPIAAATTNGSAVASGGPG
jgi:hypothetical protein